MCPTFNNLIRPLIEHKIIDRFHSTLWKPAEGVAIEITEIRAVIDELVTILSERVSRIKVESVLTISYLHFRTLSSPQ
jgi:hypothetical protein